MLFGGWVESEGSYGIKIPSFVKCETFNTLGLLV